MYCIAMNYIQLAAWQAACRPWQPTNQPTMDACWHPLNIKILSGYHDEYLIQWQSKHVQTATLIRL